MRRHRAFLAMVLVVAAVGPALAQRAPEVEGEDIDTRLETVVSSIDQLETLRSFFSQDLGAGPLTRSASLVEMRFNEGVYAYLVENYDRASLLMYSLLFNQDISDPKLRAQAQWYLADALFQQNDLASAATFFRQIVDGDPHHPFYQDAVARMLEIMGRTGSDREFEVYYTRFLHTAIGGSSNPRVRYVLGKTLYERHDLPRATEILADFPPDTSISRQAWYLAATVWAAMGRQSQLQELGAARTKELYEYAINRYQRVFELPIALPEHQVLQDLTWLAIGRIHLELNRPIDAVNAYQRISWSSPQFADALYETTWALVSNGNFDEALRTIDIFELAFPLDTRHAELELLAAHLQVKREDWQQAISGYQEVSDRYGMIRDQLDRILDERADPIIFFNQLVEEGTALIEEDLVVPQLALRIARDDPRINQSIGLARELQTMRAAINQSNEVIYQVERVLHSQAQGRLLETYRMGHQNIQRLAAQAQQLKIQLATIEADHLIAAAGAHGDTREFGERRASLDDLGGFNLLENEQGSARHDHLALQANAIAERGHRVFLDTEKMLRELDALEVFLADARPRGLHEPHQEAQLAREIELLRDEVQGQRETARSAMAAVDARRIARELAGSTALHNQLPDRFGERLDEAIALHAMAKDLREQARGHRAATFFTSIDDQWYRLDQVEQWALQMHQRLDDLEALEVEELRVLIGDEKQAIAGQDADAYRYDQRSRRLHGTVAHSGFLNVQQQFSDLVMQADLGLVDVFWIVRTQEKKKLHAIAEDRARTLEELRIRFKDVLSGFEDVEEVLLEEELEEYRMREALEQDQESQTPPDPLEGSDD